MANEASNNRNDANENQDTETDVMGNNGSLSQSEKLELIIFGYIRLNSPQEIPDDITRICVNYYNKIEIIWDVFNSQLKEYVSENGLEVKLSNKRDDYSAFASSIGWNEGIHSFTLQKLDGKGHEFGVGIVSSEEMARIGSADDEYFLFTNEPNVVGYSLDYLTIYEVKNCRWTNDCVPTGLSNIKAGDKVTVVVDCIDWKLTFYINDKVCNKSIDIVKDKEYHAVFTIWKNRMLSFRLIETSIDIDMNASKQSPPETMNII